MSDPPSIKADTPAEPAPKKKRSRLWRVLAVSLAGLLVIGGAYGVYVYIVARDVLACQNSEADPEASIRNCTAIIARKANSEITSEAYTNRGVSYDMLRKFDNALADLNEATRLDPRNSRAFLEKGVTYTETHDLEKAFVAFTDAILIRPDYGLAFRNRGFVYLSMGQGSRAVDDFDAALRIDPRDARAFYLRGNARSMINDQLNAIADYRSALALDPSFKEPFGALRALGVEN